MKTITTILMLSALILTGCLTQQQLIEQRIKDKQDFFNTLAPEKQERLRKGKIYTGDSAEAAWIVYGNPDRKFTKVTGTTTNEIWSYSSYEFDRFNHAQPIYHPMYTSQGRTIWQSDYRWASDTQYQVYEHMRIEFQNNKIKGYESEQK
ncbi:MAG: hypothetical protein PF904_15985 [Kiritimatiellae bacterium]|nr:hypothetical protein [Kiritimatiellia bacterium]